MSEDLRLSTALAKAEKAHIRMVLDQTNWNRRKAADVLGICYRTMLYRSGKYGFGEGEYQKMLNEREQGSHLKCSNDPVHKVMRITSINEEPLPFDMEHGYCRQCQIIIHEAKPAVIDKSLVSSVPPEPATFKTS